MARVTRAALGLEERRRSRFRRPKVRVPRDLSLWPAGMVVLGVLAVNIVIMAPHPWLQVVALATLLVGAYTLGHGDGRSEYAREVVADLVKGGRNQRSTERPAERGEGPEAQRPPEP